MFIVKNNDNKTASRESSVQRVFVPMKRLFAIIGSGQHLTTRVATQL